MTNLSRHYPKLREVDGAVAWENLPDQLGVTVPLSTQEKSLEEDVTTREDTHASSKQSIHYASPTSIIHMKVDSLEPFHTE